VGYHSLPKIKSLTETTLNMGRPSLKRKITISARINMETSAKKKKIFFMIISLSFLDITKPSQNCVLGHCEASERTEGIAAVISRIINMLWDYFALLAMTNTPALL